MPIGLGFNLTILNILKSAGHIGSRTWSLCWGLAGATAHAQVDGSLVFGGYDAGKVKGPNFTQPLTASAC